MDIKQDIAGGFTEANIRRAATALQYVSTKTVMDLFVQGDKKNAPMDPTTAYLLVKAGKEMLDLSGGI